VAQQLGTLASLPPLVVVALIDLQILTPSVGLALVFGLVLLIADVLMYRVVSGMFDRERLLTGAPTRGRRSHSPVA
jgi:ABC-2 type transport system permease protein